MSEAYTDYYFDYSIEEWLKSTHITFVKLQDIGKDFLNISLFMTLNTINKNLYKFAEKHKNESERSEALIIASLFAPLFMNFYIYKYYMNFKGSNCNVFDPTGDFESILQNEDLLKNSGELLKTIFKKCGGC